MGTKLLEICVWCGFVHRDDRDGLRQRKAHYHWIPEDGEGGLKVHRVESSNEPHVTRPRGRGEIDVDLKLHATICFGCLTALRYPQVPEWARWAKGRAHMDPQFRVPLSLNAPLLFAPHEGLLQAKLDGYYTALLNLLPREWALQAAAPRPMGGGR